MDRLEKAIEIVKRFNDEYCKRSPCCTDCKKLDECNAYFGEDRPYELLEPLLLLDEQIFKEYNIQLKNIDTSMSFCELKNKLIEDREKFEDAVADCILSNYCVEDEEKYDKYAIESLWDMIQTGLEMINMAGISADEVMEGYNEYLEKIKK